MSASRRDSITAVGGGFKISLLYWDMFQLSNTHTHTHTHTHTPHTHTHTHTHTQRKERIKGPPSMPLLSRSLALSLSLSVSLSLCLLFPPPPPASSCSLQNVCELGDSPPLIGSRLAIGRPPRPAPVGPLHMDQCDMREPASESGVWKQEEEERGKKGDRGEDRVRRGWRGVKGRKRGSRGGVWTKDKQDNKRERGKRQSERWILLFLAYGWMEIYCMHCAVCVCVCVRVCVRVCVSFAFLFCLFTFVDICVFSVSWYIMIWTCCRVCLQTGLHIHAWTNSHTYTHTHTHTHTFNSST